MLAGITILDDLSSGYRENLNEAAEFILGDVTEPGVVEEAASEADVILHLAASVGIFGELKTLPIAEDHVFNPDSPYGVSKLAAEKACLAYNKLYDMKNVCLRYFNVYGSRQRYDAYGNVIPTFAERMPRGQDVLIFGDGEQTRDFVNVGDVAMANYAAALSPDATGCFNLGSGTRVSINGLAAMMLRISGSDSRLVYSAPRPGDVRDSLAAIDVAASALGYVPSVDLEDGLTEYLRWLRDDPVTLARWEAQT